MSVDVLAWNIEDAFSKEKAHAQTVLDRILATQPDVAVFSEAFAEGQYEHVAHLQASFEHNGYETAFAPYNDDDGRKDRHMLLVITRAALTEGKHPEITRLTSRNAIISWLHDPASGTEVEFTGVHLDDRTEQRRYGQALALPHGEDNQPRIIAGDMNSVHPKAPRHPKLAIARTLAIATNHGLPVKEPGTEPSGTSPVNKLHDKLGRIGSLGSRLDAMAGSKVMELMLEKGFYDADYQERRPTMPASAPIVQLDHILLSAHSRPEDFHVFPEHEGIDHRAIMSTVAVGY